MKYTHDITIEYNTALEIVQNEYPELDFTHWATKDQVLYDTKEINIWFADGNSWQLTEEIDDETAQPLYDELENHVDFEDIHMQYDLQIFQWGQNGEKWMIEYCECEAMQLQRFYEPPVSHSIIMIHFHDFPTEDQIIEDLRIFAFPDQFTEKQVEAIIKRKCGFTLSSTERRHLQIIRKKLDKSYEILEQAKTYNFDDI